MKKVAHHILISLASCCLLSGGALGQQIDQKIGFIHFRDALQGTHEAKAEIDQVQQYVEQKNQESNQLFEGLNRLREELRTKGRTLNADALGELQSQIQSKETALKRFQEDTQRDINQRRDAIFRKYGQKLQQVVTEYAQANGYDVIFLLDQFQYAYLDPALVLTEPVIAAYDQKYPANGGASTSPPG
ncbi:MAG: OmpH family outer membrane protein [Acidobacteriota bacterium]